MSHAYLKRVHAVGAAAAAGLALLVASATVSPAAGQSDKCDPNRAVINRAIKLRDTGQPRQATSLLNGILKADSENFGANYILGTIELSSGGASADAGLNRLVANERRLGGKDKDCARELGWYSIYNTIGAQFYRKKNLGQSERYLLQGYAHLQDMPLYTRRLILSNLGLLYFAKGDADKSLKFYQEAARAGSTDAQKRAAIIRRVKNGT